MERKKYNVNVHTKNLAFENKLIRDVTRVDNLLSLAPNRVVYDFKKKKDTKK